MGKRIIVLSDGTGNSAAKVWRTNVWRIFESIDLKESDQVAVYDDGVGTSSFKPLALLGGAFGIGLKRNVLGLYKFLCRTYKSKQDYEVLAKAADGQCGSPNSGMQQVPEFKDDEIFLFGFSRGAFTVRILTGLVLNQGLVHFNSERELGRKARAAYRAYRTSRFPRKNLEYPLRLVRNLLATHTHNPNERHVERIRFIGVWDTVAAYGSPVEEMTLGFSQYIWPLELPNCTLSDRVDRACQALAIDEERTTFAPVLWDEPSMEPPDETRKETISQVWFSGVHSNVGGGYPDDSLAKVSLNWMMAEAAACGLRFKTAPDADPDAFRHADAAQDKDGRLYDSRSGLGGYYRYGPRRIGDYYPPAQPRVKPIPKIHDSVFARIQTGAHLYAPIGIPAEYAVVGADNRSIHRLGNSTRESLDSAARRHEVQESVWNVVWRRRAIYFLTVFASLYMAFYPLLRESYSYQVMVTRLRIVSDAIRLLGAFLPSGASRWIDGYARDPAWFLLWVGVIAFLISYASTLKLEINSRMRRIWDAHASNGRTSEGPSSSGIVWRGAWWIFLALMAYVALYPILGFARLPEPLNSLVDTYTERPIRFVLCAFLIINLMPEGAIQPLRTSALYRQSLSFIKYQLAPLFFALLIIYGAFALSNHVLFNLRDSFGSFCERSVNEKGPLNARNTGFECVAGICMKTINVFDASRNDAPSLCLPTGVFAERGKRYAIGVYRDPPGTKWEFWGEPAFMSGQPISRLEWWKQPIMAMLFPLRRTWDRPWGSFIVRYGPTGTEESFLDREPPPLDDDLVNPPGFKGEDVPEDREVLGEAWTARRDGEIYVYLNKPVLGIWGAETWISRLIRTNGTARINIERR
jgi:uncharacterized protein (DUF2235 family)